MARNPIRRALLALLFLLPVAAVCQPVKSLPRPTNYVSDFAHVMWPAVIQQLNQVCLQVDRQAHAQIAVVTVTTVLIGRHGFAKRQIT